MPYDIEIVFEPDKALRAWLFPGMKEVNRAQMGVPIQPIYVNAPAIWFEVEAFFSWRLNWSIMHEILHDVLTEELGPFVDVDKRDDQVKYALSVMDSWLDAWDAFLT